MTQQVTETYDALGDMLTASNNTGTVTMTYDGLGRELTEQDPIMAQGTSTPVTVNTVYSPSGPGQPNQTTVSDSLRSHHAKLRRQRTADHRSIERGHGGGQGGVPIRGGQFARPGAVADASPPACSRPRR